MYTSSRTGLIDLIRPRGAGGDWSASLSRDSAGARGFLVLVARARSLGYFHLKPGLWRGNFESFLFARRVDEYLANWRAHEVVRLSVPGRYLLVGAGIQGLW